MEEPLHRSGAGHAMAVGAAVTVVCSLPLFLTVALPNQLGDEFGFGPVGIGAAVAVFFGTVALTSLHLGRVADGAGTVTSLRTAALGAASASTYIALVASSWIELAASLVVAALAAALAQPATNRLLADRIPAHRLGMAFGLKQSAPPVASMLAGLSVPVVALTIGWRWGYALAAVGAIAAAFAVGPRPARAQRPCRPRRRDRSPLGARPTLVLLVAGFGLAFATNSIVLAFYVEAAIRAGSSHQFAGSVLAGASLVAVMTRLVAGAACDRYAFDPLRLCALLLGVGAVGLVFLATGRGELMALGAWASWAAASTLRIMRNRCCAVPSPTRMSLTCNDSSTVRNRPCRVRASTVAASLTRSLSAMMNPLPPPDRTLRLSLLVNPASMTHTVRFTRHPARSFLTSVNTVWSPVSPGHTHRFTGSLY